MLSEVGQLNLGEGEAILVELARGIPLDLVDMAGPLSQVLVSVQTQHKSVGHPRVRTGDLAANRLSTVDVVEGSLGHDLKIFEGVCRSRNHICQLFNHFSWCVCEANSNSIINLS